MNCFFTFVILGFVKIYKACKDHNEAEIHSKFPATNKFFYHNLFISGIRLLNSIVVQLNNIV